MKSLLAVVALVAVCAGQGSLPNTAVLDNGNFIVRWSAGPTGSASLAAELEIQANCTGWVSVMLVSASGSYADVHWGGYNVATETGYLLDMHLNLTTPHGLPAEDASQDLIFQGAVFHDPWTIIRMKRLADTGDAANDVPLVRGPMTLGWAYSNSNSPDVPHVAAGLTTITFVP